MYPYYIKADSDDAWFSYIFRWQIQVLQIRSVTVFALLGMPQYEQLLNWFVSEFLLAVFYVTLIFVNRGSLPFSVLRSSFRKGSRNLAYVKISLLFTTSS
jgi:hypothetical protein